MHENEEVKDKVNSLLRVGVVCVVVIDSGWSLVSLVLLGIG